MNPHFYRVSQADGAALIAREIVDRLRDGPVSVVISKAGEENEFQLWQRRYRKLVSLLSDNVVQDGIKYTPAGWDAKLKVEFLLMDEIELPGGRRLAQLPSTKRMPREDREEYLSQVREFAAERGIFLQHPGDD